MLTSFHKLNIFIKMPKSIHPLPHSQWGLEYANSIPLMVRLQFWSSEDWEVSFYCHYSQIHSEPEW